MSFLTRSITQNKLMLETLVVRLSIKEVKKEE